VKRFSENLSRTAPFPTTFEKSDCHCTCLLLTLGSGVTTGRGDGSPVVNRWQGRDRQRRAAFTLGAATVLIVKRDLGMEHSNECDV
jgi:hypothetical protein